MRAFLKRGGPVQQHLFRAFSELAAPPRAAKFDRWITTALPAAAGRRRRLSARAASSGASAGAHIEAAPLDAKLKKWDIAKSKANYTELSPLTFLKRAERVYPDYTSVVHGSKSFTWRQTAGTVSRKVTLLLVARVET